MEPRGGERWSSPGGGLRRQSSRGSRRTSTGSVPRFLGDFSSLNFASSRGHQHKDRGDASFGRRGYFDGESEEEPEEIKKGKDGPFAWSSYPLQLQWRPPALSSCPPTSAAGSSSASSERWEPSGGLAGATSTEKSTGQPSLQQAVDDLADELWHARSVAAERAKSAAAAEWFRGSEAPAFVASASASEQRARAAAATAKAAASACQERERVLEGQTAAAGLEVERKLAKARSELEQLRSRSQGRENSSRGVELERLLRQDTRLLVEYISALERWNAELASIAPSDTARTEGATHSSGGRLAPSRSVGALATEFQKSGPAMEPATVRWARQLRHSPSAPGGTPNGAPSLRNDGVPLASSKAATPRFASCDRVWRQRSFSPPRTSRRGGGARPRSAAGRCVGVRGGCGCRMPKKPMPYCTYCGCDRRQHL